MYRIMIVEDDEVIANAIRQHLVSWGMEAFCVQDFSDVLTEFAATGPQLVLMDIHLPFLTVTTGARRSGKCRLIHREHIRYPHGMFGPSLSKPRQEAWASTSPLYIRSPH